MVIKVAAELREGWTTNDEEYYDQQHQQPGEDEAEADATAAATKQTINTYREAGM